MGQWQAIERLQTAVLATAKVAWQLVREGVHSLHRGLLAATAKGKQTLNKRWVWGRAAV